MKQIEWDIIERKLDGELSPDEESCFGEWYAANKENKDYFHRIEKFYQENGFVKEIIDEDTNASWNKFATRLEKKKPGKSRNLLYWSVSGVAACLLIGVLVFTLGRQKDMVPSDQVATISAGGNKAILTLSNGVSVELENNSNEMNDASVKIVNTGSVLSYEERMDTVIKEEVFNKVMTPRGGEYGITLSDGTKVYLGALSQIEYPVAFAGDKRVVKASGEIFFDVAHDAKHPFIVEMKDQRIEVLGTAFNVRDYEDEEYIETTLVRGKVKVSAGDKSCILEPSQQSVLDKKNNMMIQREVNVDEFVDWKNGKLNIRNQRLEDILTRLSKWYDVYVFYANEDAKDVRFYANIDRYSDLNKLLDKFEKTGQVKFNIKGNVIYVYTVE